MPIKIYNVLINGKLIFVVNLFALEAVPRNNQALRHRDYSI